MNALVKLITESEETTEFWDFYTEPTGTWTEQLVNFLISRGFNLIITHDYYDYRHGEYFAEIYELVKSNVHWDNTAAAEKYIFELCLPKKSEFPAFLYFSMYVKYTDSPILKRMLYYSERIDEKNPIAKKVEFMKRLVEKTIALANEIRPTGNSDKLKSDLIKCIKRRYSARRH